MMKVYICPKCQEEMKWNVLNVEMKRWFWQRFLMRNMGR